MDSVGYLNTGRADSSYDIEEEEWQPADDEDPHHSSQGLRRLRFFVKPRDLLLPPIEQILPF